MITFLICIGYGLFVLAGCAWAMFAIAMLFFGGGDCGPLFGNWVHPGARQAFFINLALVIAYWYGLWYFFPFDLSLGLALK